MVEQSYTNFNNLHKKVLTSTKTCAKIHAHHPNPNTRQAGRGGAVKREGAGRLTICRESVAVQAGQRYQVKSFPC